MYKLLQYQSCCHSRSSLSFVQNYALLTRYAVRGSFFKQNIKTLRTKRRFDNSELGASNIFRLCSWKVGLGFGASAIIKIISNNFVVNCESEVRGRLAGRSSKNRKPSFDWRRFWSYLWPHRLYIIGAIAAALTVAALNIFIPHMIGVVINILADVRDGVVADFVERIQYPALKLITLYLSQAFCTFLYIHLLSEVGEKVACQMKVDLFDSIMRQDISFFDVERTGELVNRLTVDIQDFKSSFKATISNGLRAMTQIVGSVLSLMVISPQLTGLTLLCVPSVVIGGTFIGSLLRRLSREAQDQMERATSVADEAISNIRTVKAFAAEEAEVAMFSAECEKAAVLARELGLGVGLFQAGTNLFLNCMVLSTLFLGGHLMSSGQLNAGDVMAFLINSQTIQRSMAQLSLLFGAVIKGLSAGGRVFEYINHAPSMPQTKGGAIKYHEFKGDVQFSNVTFSYPTREKPVLKDFNLLIPAGKTVAIVGSSGNGKSTIAALLERFYDVNGGSVTIDGDDIRGMDIKWLRGRALGFISQEPILFATTIMENIRYGMPSATDEQVYKAAKLAFADDFIKSFPRGYDTVVGERGISLSGGQKQRIAIARALIKEPPILILDEATSALDTESEHMVQKALVEASKGRTVLVIAHRLSTVRNADLIVVLQKGQIAEIGTHESLKELKGIYWHLIREQELDFDDK